ncbi:hypothetical protein V8C44DRAFT_87481 [Trichoderma aethiopicum]
MDGRLGWCRSWRPFGSPETNWLAVLSVLRRCAGCLCLCSCSSMCLHRGLGDRRYLAAAISPTTRPLDHVLIPIRDQDTQTRTLSAGRTTTATAPCSARVSNIWSEPWVQWLSPVPASPYRLLIIKSFRCRYQWMLRDARSQPDRGPPPLRGSWGFARHRLFSGHAARLRPKEKSMRGDIGATVQYGDSSAAVPWAYPPIGRSLATDAPSLVLYDTTCTYSERGLLRALGFNGAVTAGEAPATRAGAAEC